MVVQAVSNIGVDKSWYSPASFRGIYLFLTYATKQYLKIKEISTI